MKKAMEQMRKAVADGKASKVLEQSAVIGKASDKEKNIACYMMSQLIESGKIGVGYQFGLKRFNREFVDWENGKSVEKAGVIPTVKEIANACKSIYLDCEKFGFFPIVKTNSDGAIIIDCIKWIADFYAVKSESKAKESKARAVHIDYEDLLEMLRNSDIDTLRELQSDITAILNTKIVVHKKTA